MCVRLVGANLVHTGASPPDMKKNSNSEKNIPAWFNKEQEVLETTKEDIEEMDKILSELV